MLKISLLFKKNTNLFRKLTGKHQCWSLFNKGAGLFIKKRLQHMCFPVNIMKFSRTPILKNICEQLLL